jgi:hypothetical protein
MVIHTECLPDETLLKKIGFTRQQILHHQGKPRIMSLLSQSTNQLAVVDEDPGTVPHPYQAKLSLERQAHGLLLYKDTGAANTIIVLRVKLEDWIIAACKQSRKKMSDYSLPGNPTELHSVLNHRIPALEKLIDDLLEAGNPSVDTLREWTGG